VIRSAEIRNFRSIRSLDLALEPLTILVGPNASGKTSILRALDPTRHWQLADFPDHRPELVPTVNVRLGNSQEIGRGQGAPNRWQAEVFKMIRFDLAKLRSVNLLQEAHELGEAGENLTNVFGSLTRKDQTSLASQLCELVPVFSDVDRRSLNNGQQSLRFQDRWAPAAWYSPEEVSDGTILLLAFLTLQYQQPSVDIIAVEEPERGLHPYLLGQLVDFFRKLSEGKIGPKPVQVILATHSAELLEHVRPEEVRFISRDTKSGNVLAEKVDTSTQDWKSTFDEYRKSLGDVWLSGGLGGVPGAP
jgi:predicted ATPase